MATMNATLADAWLTFKYLLDARAAMGGGYEAIAARQRQRLQDLIAHARAHSPYFAEAYRHLPDGVSDLAALPITTKRGLMARFDDWPTDRAVTRQAVSDFLADPANIGADFLGRYAVWTTSGTTGEPAVLVHDRRSLAVYIGVGAVRVLPDRQTLWKLMRRGTRMAGVYVTGGHFLAYSMTMRRLRERPWTRRTLRVISALDPLDRIVAQLGAFQPTILGGYPSVLRQLAGEQMAGRLHIDPVIVTAGGEALSDEARAFISKAFGAPVASPYACSEAGMIAAECAERWQHVNADWTILEAVNADHRPTPPGEQSHSTLLTYLGNRLQPILRYELGDRVIERPDPCPCGDPMPAFRVEGRTNDVLRFRAVDGSVREVLPLAISSCFDEARVGRFQLVQTAPEALSVRIELTAGPEAWAEASTGLRAFLDRHGLANVEVLRAAEPPAAERSSGKFRQVFALPGAMPA